MSQSFNYSVRLGESERDLSFMTPGKASLAAMRETEDMKRNPDAYDGYDDVQAMMKELWR